MLSGCFLCLLDEQLSGFGDACETSQRDIVFKRCEGVLDDSLVDSAIFDQHDPHHSIRGAPLCRLLQCPVPLLLRVCLWAFLWVLL